MALTTTAVVGMVIAAFVGRWLTQGMSGAEYRRRLRALQKD